MILFLLVSVVYGFGGELKISTCPIIFLVTGSVSPSTKSLIPSHQKKTIMSTGYNLRHTNETLQMNGDSTISFLNSRFTNCMELFVIETDDPRYWVVPYWIEQECIKRKRISMCVILSQYSRKYHFESEIPQFHDINKLLKRVKKVKSHVAFTKNNQPYTQLIWDGPVGSD